MQLSPRALPSGDYVLKTFAELQRDADTATKSVSFIEISGLYSDGSCAVLHVGGKFAWPKQPATTHLCCCSALDFYEKRANGWVFVRRAYEMCS